MKKILLLCLLSIGCATTQEEKPPTPIVTQVKKPEDKPKNVICHGLELYLKKNREEYPSVEFTDLGCEQLGHTGYALYEALFVYPNGEFGYKIHMATILAQDEEGVWRVVDEVVIGQEYSLRAIMDAQRVEEELGKSL